MNKPHFLSLVLLTVLLAPSAALEGKGGYVATPLFTIADVSAAVTYDAGFAGERWADMDTFAFGAAARTVQVGEEEQIALGANGDVLFLVWGRTVDAEYTGLISWDGAAFRHVVQDALVNTGGPVATRPGRDMRAVIVSPVTAGNLQAGHAVVVWIARTEIAGDTHLEIWSIDPADGSETLVHRWLSQRSANARVAIDGSGTLYAIHNGILDASGNPVTATMRKLVWNGTGYNDTTLATGVEGSVEVGPDGFLYTFEDHGGAGWATTNGTKPQILRMDPVTGATTDYADVDGSSHIKDWVWDSNGKLFLALKKRGNHSISEVIEGGTVTTKRGSIASSSTTWVSLAAGNDGSLHVMELTGNGGADEVVSQLAPDPDGGGGGGGGNGGGKGKPK